MRLSQSGKSLISTGLKMTQAIKKLTKSDLVAMDARGKTILFAVGIDNYDSSVGFPALKTCSNDAVRVKDAFSEIYQLNADSERLQVITSKSEITPSRGIIIKNLQGIANQATENDVLVFYFSGHGHRIESNEELFLVPEDAYDSEDPDSLIGLNRIIGILNSSAAKYRLIILDACLSGPIVGKKLVPHTVSRKFINEYVKNTRGITILSSSSFDQVSYTQSPDTRCSLFTYYLIRALRGEPDALKDEFLTLSSLNDYLSTEVPKRAKSYGRNQIPSIDSKSSGVLVLGDFSRSLLPEGSLDFSGQPIESVEFSSESRMKVKEVLTNIQKWTYSQEYLAEKVNGKLGEDEKERFGQIVAKLHNDAGFSEDSIGADDRTIFFPDGYFYVEYLAQDQRSGVFRQSVVFERPWFDSPHNIPTILNCFGMYTDKLSLHLEQPIEPSLALPGLKAKGWKIVSMLDTQIVAKIGDYTISMEPDTVHLSGFVAKELFSTPDPEQVSLLSGVLLLLQPR